MKNETFTFSTYPKNEIRYKVSIRYLKQALKNRTDVRVFDMRFNKNDYINFDVVYENCIQIREYISLYFPQYDI